MPHQYKIERGIVQTILYWIKNFLQVVFPPKCLSCYELVSGEIKGLCSSCHAKIMFISDACCHICGKAFGIDLSQGVVCASCLVQPPIYDCSRSLIKFDLGSKNIIHALKYYDKTILIKFFASLLHSRFHSIIEDADYIVFVPMHKWKRIMRMYNHAHLLSLYLSKISKRPMIKDLLIKVKLTKSQTGLSKKDREKNLKNSIVMNGKNKKLIKGKKLLLVDDVLTTGSTINLCSKLLKKAGAEKIYVLTIART